MGIFADWPYAPRYIQVYDSFIHYVEDGSGEPLLFLHGNPTWSYQWRNVMPHLAPYGRCIAMDLAGMGRSGKPGIDYTFLNHARYVEGFIDALGLENITLVLHDWGGALGLYWALHHPGRARALALLGNSPLSMGWQIIGSWEAAPHVFHRYRAPVLGWHLVGDHNYFIERTLRHSVLRGLTEEEMGFYREPYPTVASRKPLQRWNTQVPIAGDPPEMVPVVEAIKTYYETLTLPKLLIHGSGSRGGTPPWIEWSKKNIPNTETCNLGQVGHYMTEDKPDDIGQAIATWFRRL